MTAPSILIVDDGELDRVVDLLARSRRDWLRNQEADLAQLELPRDLLITSGSRALRMPPMRGEHAPTWLCIYDQDFPPLRERLKALGVHYLVSGDLAPRPFQLFLRQILHQGDERRSVRRIPLYCEIGLRCGTEMQKAELVELSRESCVFVTAKQLDQGSRVTIELPPHLTGSDAQEFHGEVLRSFPDSQSGPEGIVTVLGFGLLGAEAMHELERVLTGRAPGTQVTPLRPESIGGPAQRKDAPQAVGSGYGAPGAPAFDAGDDAGILVPSRLADPDVETAIDLADDLADDSAPDEVALDACPPPGEVDAPVDGAPDGLHAARSDRSEKLAETAVDLEDLYPETAIPTTRVFESRLDSETLPAFDDAEPAETQAEEDEAERYETQAGEDEAERRESPRLDCERRVDAIRFPGSSDARAGMSRDLSATGVRVEISPPPPLGSEISVALYLGGPREEPLLLDAEVVRVHDSEVGLRFANVGDEAQRKLLQALDQQPQVESLASAPGSRQIAEILPR